MKRLLLLLGVTALLGAACGGPPEPQGSVLNRGLGTDPESLDPHKARSTQALDVLRDIGEGLTAFSPSGELRPAAATSWQISEDGRTYTFTIRENARWSNGEPVTANDFEFSLKRLVDPGTGAFYAQILIDVMERVEALDARTLEVQLRQPTPYLLSVLTHPSTFPIYRPALDQHGDAFARPGRLVSNGAYVLDTWEPTSFVGLVRNEHYWNNAQTCIDVVRYHINSQELAEYNRYRSGELHITDNVPTDGFHRFREQFPDELRIAPKLGVYFYGFNLSKPPFKDNPRLRQALSMAIDRDKLVEKVTGRGELPAYSFVPPGVANYQPVTFGYAKLTQDDRNAIAQRLMRELGYGPENPLEIELRYNTSDAQRRVALAIQAMWDEVLGVKTNLVNEEFQVLLSNIRQAEVTQIFRASWIGDYNDAHTFLGLMIGEGTSNMPGYANPEFDSLMQRAAQQFDLDRRRLYLEEAERVLLADHPIIPIYFYVSKHLVSTDVSGWEDNVLDNHYSQHLCLNAAD